MRIPALTVVFLAGTASPLSAEPPAAEPLSAESEREESTDRTRYRDGPAARPRAEPGWTEIASPTPASHAREFIWVDADAGRFTRLRLAAAAGRPAIRAVRVDYRDGDHAVFAIDKVLAARRRPVYVDLQGAREIRQITVTTDPGSRGTYVVEGYVDETGIATR